MDKLEEGYYWIRGKEIDTKYLYVAEVAEYNNGQWFSMGRHSRSNPVYNDLRYGIEVIVLSSRLEPPV